MENKTTKLTANKGAKMTTGAPAQKKQPKAKRVDPEEDILLAASVNDDENLLEGAQWIKYNTQNSNIEGPILF